MQSLLPEDVIRIHSASDEGAAAFNVQPTSPNCCFPSIEFKMLIYVRLRVDSGQTVVVFAEVLVG